MYIILLIIIIILIKINKKYIRKFLLKLSYGSNHSISTNNLSEPLLDDDLSSIDPKNDISKDSNQENPKIILYNNKFQMNNNVGYYLYDDINEDIHNLV